MKRKLPTYLVKCAWRGTAVTLRIQAKDEEDAWARAARKVQRMFGGMSCMDIIIKGVVID